MPTYRLLVEYDGGKFAGWQVQATGRTVQGTLLAALAEATGERPLDLQGAGRTDAGVHALGQVASLRCRTTLDCSRLADELERRLPSDLAVREIRRVPRTFHARHDAVARSYRYQIARRRSAFGKRTTWWVPGTIDTTAMAHGAAAFVGRHDFRTLVRRPRELESTVVEVETCSVAVVGDYVLIRLVASHFLWNQVRRMVGVLATIGRGDAEFGDVRHWLTGHASPPQLAAPAAGLFLEAVRYPSEPWSLPPLLPVGVPIPTLCDA
jgi:tRNA pseudouridine38-40 synthase